MATVMKKEILPAYSQTSFSKTEKFDYFARIGNLHKESDTKKMSVRKNYPRNAFPVKDVNIEPILSNTLFKKQVNIRVNNNSNFPPRQNAAVVISEDIMKFRIFKEKLRSRGMVTHCGVQQILPEMIKLHLEQESRPKLGSRRHI